MSPHPDPLPALDVPVLLQQRGERERDTAIELSELRQDRSADFSPLPAVLGGPEGSGLKSALLNSTAVGAGGGFMIPMFICDHSRLMQSVILSRARRGPHPGRPR